MKLIITQKMINYFKNFPFSYQNLDHLVGQDYEGALKNIRRFNSKDYMIYRTNLFDHIEIGKLMIEKVVNKNPKIIINGELLSLNLEYQQLLFQHHDDTEIVLSDVPSPIKRNLNYKDKINLQAWENLAINILAKYGSLTVNGYPYFRILNSNYEKLTSEVQLNSIFDKKQAYRQALIEVKKGNFSFVEAIWNYPQIINETIDKYGLDNYVHEFLKREKEFPLIKDKWEHIDKLFNDEEYFLDEIKEYLYVVNSYNPKILFAQNEYVPLPVLKIKELKI